MADVNDIDKAKPGDQVAKYTGSEITYGRIRTISPQRAHLTVQWETGKTTKLHHSRFASITLADHRQRKQKPDP